MKPETTERLQSYVAELIAEGERVSSHPRTVSDGYDPAVPIDLFSRWVTKCRHLPTLLGEHARPWDYVLLGVTKNSLSNAICLLGTLRGIDDMIRAGLLIRLEDLVRADAFGDLLEQADYLLSEACHVAAGVLARAVLEEQLRNWCDRVGCMPAKERPTLGDYNAALYRAKQYDKLTMKHVEAMTAIGNDAAHNERGSRLRPSSACSATCAPSCHNTRSRDRRTEATVAPRSADGHVKCHLTSARPARVIGGADTADRPGISAVFRYRLRYRKPQTRPPISR